MNAISTDNIYVVILAGGKGTRFWPLSRDLAPKQLLRITGSRTMIEQTVARVSPLVSSEGVCIVANSFIASEIKACLHLEAERMNFIIEPQGKNTAPAVGLAAIYIRRLAPDPVMIVLPSDHFIKEEDEFIDILNKGITLALRDYLVAIGIKPARPETGYGYIKTGERCEVKGERGEKVNAGQEFEAYEVERFVEKPDHHTACRYLEEGGYYWNSGIFLWRTSTVLRDIETFMPDLYRGLMRIDEAIGTGREETRKKEVFADLEPESIDYGVMERSNRVVVIPADMGWNDVGSFNALSEIAEKDKDGNVISGNVFNIETENSIIYGSNNRLLAVLGLRDTIVVDTEDVTLVCPKDRAQDVKRIVDGLKKKGAKGYL